MANLAKGSPKGEINPSRLEEKAEQQLYLAWQEAKQELDRLLSTRCYEDSLKVLRSLKKPADDFFDQVLVITDEQHIRENRLRLLAGVQALFASVANFSPLAEVAGRNNIP